MTKGIVISIILAILVLAETRRLSIHPFKSTRFGVFKGKWMAIISRSVNRTVAAYLGVPYAQPPIEDLRFKNPVPWNETWEHNRPAVEDGSMCPQLNLKNEVMGNEDCLFLNIFMPEDAQKKRDVKYSVLVFVHGGAYTNGSNNSTFYSPEYLLYEEIILVTVNYRLGALGFLSTGDDLAPGNWGLKDIKMALQWIQNNIHVFGGNPESVTLWGHDSGAALVHILALSNKTEGLFHKYITSGGSSLAHYAVDTAAEARMLAVIAAYRAKCLNEKDMGDMFKCLDEGERNISTHCTDVTLEFNCTAHLNMQRILDCVGNLTIDEILRLEPDDLKSLRDKEYMSYEFTPTIENDSEDAILTASPLTLIKKGHFRDIPWITGLTKDEGLVKSVGITLHEDKITQVIDNWNIYLPYLLEFKWNLENDSAMAEAIDMFYLNENFTSVGLTELLGDAMYNWPVYQAAKLQSKFMKSNVYFYLLGYHGLFSETYRIDDLNYHGVSHGDVINYLYPYLNHMFRDLVSYNGNDHTMIHEMTELWTSFVKTGVPKAYSAPDWEPFDTDEKYMVLGWYNSSDLYMASHLLPDRMEFWKELTGNVSLPLWDEEEAANIEIFHKAAPGEAALVTNTAIIYFISFFTLRFAL